MSVQIPAKVLQWNADSIIVLCPYCNHNHHHHFNTQPYALCYRRSDCALADIAGAYELSFPFNQSSNEIGFYIDKTSGWYIRFGHRIEDPENSPGSNSRRVSTPERRRWAEGNRIHIIGNEDEGFRRLKAWLGSDPNETTSCLEITYAVSRLVNGCKSWLETYLRTSPESSLFLHGMDRDGNTALHLAACESSHEVVELLLAYKCDVNTTNGAGRTPLMEAAIWGRLQNTVLLLGAGAQIYLMDGGGRRAIDLARPSQQNDDERFHRVEHLFQAVPNNRYNPYQRLAERRQIVTILEEKERSDESAMGNTTTLNEERANLRFKTELDRCSVSLVKEFSVPYLSKTIARLVYVSDGEARIPPFAPVDAMSGWKDSTEDTLVNGLDWTAHVMQLASSLHYQLSADTMKDQGTRGRHDACHAEKQLVAYFVDKHVVLSSDVERLTRVIPPLTSPDAKIFVSRPVCSDCGRFIKEVNRQLHLNLQIEHI